jgi:hypothetical protein
MQSAALLRFDLQLEDTLECDLALQGVAMSWHLWQSTEVSSCTRVAKVNLCYPAQPSVCPA